MVLLRNLKSEEKWNKSFEKATLGKTKSKEEVKEDHERLRARILNRLNAISGSLSATKTKGMPMKTVNNSKAEYSWINSVKKFFLGLQHFERDLTMKREELEKLGKIMNRYNRVGNIGLPETKAERMKMVNKSMPEDITLAKEILKKKDQVMEQSFAKFILQVFNSFWKTVIKYKKVKESDGRVSNRGHLFMG